MKFENFSDTEIRKLEKALSFIASHELDPSVIPPGLPIIKTDAYLAECEKLLDPERTTGLENMHAALVFPNNRTNKHHLLVNDEKIDGISYVHSVSGELVNLSNFCHFFKENGHMYTFTPEKMMERYYHEFLLWSKFQATRVCSRVYMLMMWHEVNGEAPPAGGKYQFEDVALGSHSTWLHLEQLDQCDAQEQLLPLFWDLLVELSVYFGMLSFYQQHPAPGEIDSAFAAEKINQWLGLDDALHFYQLLLQINQYQDWTNHRDEVRKCIVQMKQNCKGRLIKKQKAG